MSTLVTNTITGLSTAANITIGSTPVVSASANSLTIRGEGSNQTSVQQGLAKAWLNTTDNSTNNDSLNISSVTDTATGRMTLAISTAFGATTTMTGGACASETDSSSGSGNSNRYAFLIRGANTSQAFMNSGTCSSGALTDVGLSSGSIHGDLA